MNNLRLIYSIILFTFLASGCGSKEPSSQSSTQTNNNTTIDSAMEEDIQAAKRASVEKVQKLLAQGNSMACMDEDIQITVRRQIIPEVPSPKDQRYYSINQKYKLSITEDQWLNRSMEFGSFQNVVMSNVNQNIKEMECSGTFAFDDRGYPVTYSIQSSADHGNIVVRSYGAAATQQARQFYLTTLVNDFFAMEEALAAEREYHQSESQSNSATSTFTTDEKRMINQFGPLADKCQGGGASGAELEQACEERDRLLDDLKSKQNICFGKSHQATADYEFHRCQKDSN